ncbi:TetR/AcrR family transcriptional regulator [Saccharibacillus sacchari]|uniref:TetR/AcrR family transcriptional regulator n=1 Tax=Saccharibacillus sacchari TaxID=456493 RepID=UPI0004B00B87|nr:TetR/AcrR family transcriptional regulator [Saccharibacillus sacchari]
MPKEKQHQIEEKRGRPLDLSRNKVILEATLDLLAEKGYDALTIDAVALQAKVGKGTIYRRWSSKMELVIDAATLMSPFELSLDTLNKNQDLRGQFVDLLTFVFMEDKKFQKATNAICNAFNEELDQRMRDAFYWRYRNAIESLLEPYIKKNKLTNKDMELIADIGPALVMYNLRFKNRSADIDYIKRVVDKLVVPLLPK